MAPEGFPELARVGCSACNETGYSGRVLVAEIIETSAEIRAAMRRGDLPSAPVTLRTQALEYASTGVTSVEEALLVTPDAS